MYAQFAAEDEERRRAGLSRQLDAVARTLRPEHLDRRQRLGDGGEPRLGDAARPRVRDEDAPHARIIAAVP